MSGRDLNLYLKQPALCLAYYSSQIYYSTTNKITKSHLIVEYNFYIHKTTCPGGHLFQPGQPG